MTKATEQDFKKLEGIVDAFSKAVLQKTPDAVDRFMRNLGFMEKMSIGAAKIAYESSGKSDPHTRSVKLVGYCDSVVPGLVRTFGEAALVKALPPEAKSEQVASLCQNLGGRKLAALVRKAL